VPAAEFVDLAKAALCTEADEAVRGEWLLPGRIEVECQA
jgi:hypothetical protein